MRKFLLLFGMAVLITACQTTSGDGSGGDDPLRRRITFETGVDYPASGAKRTGTLILPAGAAGATGSVPAVIMVHGTAGPDGRYTYHTAELTKAGYAVFQMDFKSGIFSGPSDRIGIKPFMPMAAAALTTLRQQPEIDPNRIALMGFSFGGALTREVFHRRFRDFQMRGKDGFAALVAFYPQCKYSMGEYINRTPQQSFAGAKLLVIAGEIDSYGDGKDCPLLLSEVDAVQPGQMELLILPGTDHGFDGDKQVMGFYDPIAINQRANMLPNRTSRDAATARYLEFLAVEMSFEKIQSGS